jgi:hypothetical protein
MSLSDKFSTALNIFLVSLVIYNIFFKSGDRPKIMDRGVLDEVHLEETGRLLNATGQLTEVGWSRHYLKEFSLNDVYPITFGFRALTPLKYKRFNYYSFTFDNKIIQLAVANVHYGSSSFINYYDLETKEFIGESVRLLPFVDSGKFPNLIDNPMNCANNTISLKKDSTDIEITTELSGEICVSKIKIQWGDKINGELTSYRNVKEEDLFDIMPVSDDNKHFFYNLKSYNNVCQGTMKIGNNSLKISKEGCMGAIDYGRGIFHYKTSWSWGAASGRTTDDRKISINIGHGIPNKNSRSVEDAFKIEGRVVKLNPLEVTYDHRNFMNGFTFKTSKNFEDEKHSADITFKVYHTHKNSENLVLINTSIDYVYGFYSGRVVDEQGQVIEFIEIPGIFELASFRW